jgi:hypothetical protein
MGQQLIPSWQFQNEGVRGYITGGGQHGVEIADVGDGLPGTRSMCLNLEHYYSRSCREGRFVPRLKARTSSSLLGKDVVSIRIDPFQEWRVRTEITYTVLPGSLIEARYHFSFLSDFDGFEALVSNYFVVQTEPYIHIGGAWVRPSIAGREHRFWARGPDQADNIRAVYPTEVAPVENVDLKVDPSYYNYPIMVTEVRETGKSAVNMVEPGYCSSLSANRLWNAHDFSILAADVKEGEEISCRAWLAICNLKCLDEAIELYEKVVDEEV